jgi:hypothetical protein
MSKLKKPWWKRPWSKSPYSRSGAGGAGKRDGEASPPIPSWDARALPPYLRELTRAAQADARLIVLRFVEEDKKLKDAWRAARLEFERAQDHLERKVSELELTRDRYEALHGAPAPRQLLWPVFFWLLVAAWFLTETPVNGYVFQIFGESAVVALAGGLMVAAILFPAAHYLGKLVRNTMVWTWKKIVFGVLLTVLPMGVVSAVAYLRGAYTNYLRNDENSAPSLDHLSSEAAVWCLLAFNLAIFFLAAYVSYKKHEKYRRELRKLESEVEDARADCESAEEACVEAATARERAFEEKRAEFEHLRRTFQQLADRYLDCNFRAREDRDRAPDGDDDAEEGGAYPHSYAADIDLELPEPLEGLNWSHTDGQHPGVVGEHADAVDEKAGDGAEQAAPAFPREPTDREATSGADTDGPEPRGNGSPRKRTSS